MIERWNLVVLWIVSISGALFNYLYGGWFPLLGILVTLVILDYITGMIASGSEGKLSSTVGLKGIGKKVYLFVMVAVGHLVDILLGGNSTMVRDTVAAFYLVNELLSILENGSRIGMPIPPILRRAIELLRNKTNGKK